MTIRPLFRRFLVGVTVAVVASVSAPAPGAGDIGSGAAEALRTPTVPGAVQDAAPEVPPVHPEGEEAISRLRSPFCPGLMLEVCPSPQAAEMRDSIRALARDGAEADSIVEWMLAEHGEEWRAVPRTEGAGLFAWIMPPLVLVAGFGVVFFVLRHLRGGRGDDPEDPGEDGELSPEEEERLARALEEMEAAGR